MHAAYYLGCRVPNLSALDAAAMARRNRALTRAMARIHGLRAMAMTCEHPDTRVFCEALAYCAYRQFKARFEESR